MTESTCTMTGRDALANGIAHFPDIVTTHLRRVASATATRVLFNAKANLAARTTGEGNTANALKVSPDYANKRYVVEFGLIQNRPANLPLWLEYGFLLRNGQFRPGIYVMHDAAKAEDAKYVSDMDAAASAGAQEALG